MTLSLFHSLTYRDFAKSSVWRWITSTWDHKGRPRFAGKHLNSEDQMSQIISLLSKNIICNMPCTSSNILIFHIKYSQRVLFLKFKLYSLFFGFWFCETETHLATVAGLKLMSIFSIQPPKCLECDCAVSKPFILKTRVVHALELIIQRNYTSFIIYSNCVNII